MLLTVLGHVDAHDRAVVVEHELRQRLRQLRLAHARGPEEQEGAERAVGIGDARPRAAHRVGYGGHGSGLADEPLADDLLHLQEFLRLALEQAPDGHSRPRGDDFGDLVGVHALGDHRLRVGVRLSGLSRLGLRDLRLDRRDLAVLETPSLLVAALADGPLEVGAQFVEPDPQLADAVTPRLLGLPPRVESGELLGLVSELGTEFVEAFGGRGVTVSVGFDEVGLLHLQAVHLALKGVDLLRRGIQLHAQAGGGFVDEVDGLVRQLAAGNVPVRKRRRGHERSVGDRHLVVRLVLRRDAAQDRHGVLHRGLAHVHLLEAPLQSRILLDALAVLVEGGGADEPQLAAREHRLEHVAGVHRALGAAARAHDRVELVDEGDDLPVGFLDLLEHGLEALFEFATVLRARHH